MLRILTFFIIFGIIISCNSKNSDADKPVEQLLDSVYTIAGIVKGAEDSTMVVLNFSGVKRKPDTTFIKNGQFEFKGGADEAIVGEVYVLNESHDLPKPLRIVVENSVINVEGVMGSFHAATVIGGINNNDFNDLKKPLMVYEDSIEVISIKAAEANSTGDTSLMAILDEQYNKLEKEKSTTVKQYAIEHPKSIGAAYFVTLEYNYSAQEIDTIYNAFDSSILQSSYVKQIKTTLDGLKRTAVGQLAPEFEMQSSNGKLITLSSLRNKYVFVDFWASWCAPCRAESPFIVQAHNRFKNKDFEILGVSLDDERQAWIGAITKDKLRWTQVSELKGWETSVVSLYGIRSIPANFLLDKEGKIIACNLQGTQLQEKLAEIFK
jgi:thiol-disulfide isomerase/thioredoxin